MGLTAEQVDGLLRTAGRAPSLHNSQPWQFHVSPRAIELHADPERTLPVADPDGREQRMACGAALFNLRLALHGHGIRPTVTILPDRGSPRAARGHPARWREGTHAGADAVAAGRPAAADQPAPVHDEAVALPEQHALRRAALDEGAWLHVVDDRPISGGAAHAAVTGAPPADGRPGLPGRARRVDHPPARAAGRCVGRGRWADPGAVGPVGHARLHRRPAGPRAGKDFEEEPLIAVLTSHLAGTAAEVQVGQALQRVLLTATAAGLATSFLSQVVEVPQTREELRRLIGATRPPQAVLRIGWPGAVSPRQGGDVMP